jgi:hypothetical protein
MMPVFWVGKGSTKQMKCKGKIGFDANLPLFGKFLCKTAQIQGNISPKTGSGGLFPSG